MNLNAAIRECEFLGNESDLFAVHFDGFCKRSLFDTGIVQNEISRGGHSGKTKKPERITPARDRKSVV